MYITGELAFSTTLLELYLSLGDDRQSHNYTCFPLFTVLLALGNPRLKHNFIKNFIIIALNYLRYYRVDLLSLDVEGAEEAILRTVPWEEVNIDLLMIEVSLL